MATQQTWYLAWVRQEAALAAAPKAGAGTFQSGKPVYFQQRKRCWIIFDGAATYVAVTTETAVAALKSCRDERGKVRLADGQEALTQRFMEAMAAQGSSFLCRPR
ncbi:MAG TPA: hypothetical protein VKT82_12185 [Ktedonobacterales bacterium]|nr:hypothetical protein [Ktedonobacterales bacterium]